MISSSNLAKMADFVDSEEIVYQNGAVYQTSHSAFAAVLRSLASIMPEITLVFDKEGIRFQDMAMHGSLLVTGVFRREENTYEIKGGPYRVYLQLADVAKIMAMVRHHYVTVFYDADQEAYLNFIFETVDKSEVIKLRIRTMEQDNDDGELELGQQEHENMITMGANQFHTHVKAAISMVEDDETVCLRYERKPAGHVFTIGVKGKLAIILASQSRDLTTDRQRSKSVVDGGDASTEKADADIAAIAERLVTESRIVARGKRPFLCESYDPAVLAAVVKVGVGSSPDVELRVGRDVPLIITYTFERVGYLKYAISPQNAPTDDGSDPYAVYDRKIAAAARRRPHKTARSSTSSENDPGQATSVSTKAKRRHRQLEDSDDDSSDNDGAGCKTVPDAVPKKRLRRNPNFSGDTTDNSTGEHIQPTAMPIGGGSSDDGF